MKIIVLFLLISIFIVSLHSKKKEDLESVDLDDDTSSGSSSDEINEIVIKKKHVTLKILSNHKQLFGKGPKFLSKKVRDARLAMRKKFVEEIQQKNGGKWEAKLVNSLGILTDRQLKMLSGAMAGPTVNRKTHICGGKDPFEVGLKPIRDLERELEFLNDVNFPFNFYDANRKKRQTGGKGVTCKEYQFDIRKKWPQCAEIISNIRDQSNCGSCWAIAAASALTDRYCIALAKVGKTLNSGNPVNYNSAADIMGCSGASFDGKDACNGGYLSKAWQFLTTTGVVSGHNYSLGGCKPYPFPSTAEATQDFYSYTANACSNRCTNSKYKNDYAGDKYKALNYNYLYSTGWEQAMKDEIFHNGTISVSMMVYADFENYGGGIYTHVTGEERGGHAIRLIGYGNITCSDGSAQKYWLGANSWNTDWGMDGIFKIARGTDECQIETRGISFGTPTLYD